MKKSEIGDKTKAAHLSYLGDARIGEGVNVGAGTITCNYDGVTKHQTVIEDHAFVGSDSQLIAPVTIHRSAYVAAGSSIYQDVPEDSLAIARSRQVIKEIRQQHDQTAMRELFRELIEHPAGIRLLQPRDNL